MFRIYLPHDVDIPYIQFGDRAYKTTSGHCIDAMYKAGPLYLQLPEATITEMRDRMLKLSISSSFYKSFIIPLEEHLVNVVHKHSQRWFNGKRFSRNKVLNGLQSPVVCNADVRTLSLCTERNASLFNQFKLPISQDFVEDAVLTIEEPIAAVGIVRLSNLQFLNNSWTYHLVLEQARVNVPVTLGEYSIVSQSDSEDDSASVERHDEYFNDAQTIDSDNHNFF